MAIEVKAQNGKPSELQLYTINKIRQAGGFAMVLYPSAFERFKDFIHDLKCEKFNRESEVILKGLQINLLKNYKVYANSMIIVAMVVRFLLMNMKLVVANCLLLQTIRHTT